MFDEWMKLTILIIYSPFSVRKSTSSCDILWFYYSTTLIVRKEFVKFKNLLIVLNLPIMEIFLGHIDLILCTDIITDKVWNSIMSPNPRKHRDPTWQHLNCEHSSWPSLWPWPLHTHFWWQGRRELAAFSRTSIW